jgi:hypothetical protein
MLLQMHCLGIHMIPLSYGVYPDVHLYVLGNSARI